MTPFNPEAINFVFEAGGAFFNWASVIQLFKDREIKGVSWVAWLLYTAWGIWEVGYVYPTLNMPYTGFLAIFRVLPNGIWVAYAMRLNYLRNRSLPV